jgi:aminoglycoside phosphotransferase
VRLDENKFTEWAESVLGARQFSQREVHGNQSVVLRLRSDDREYILKIGKRLQKEQHRLKWLATRLPVPRVFAATSIGELDALLLSVVEGVNLKILSKSWPPTKVVDKLARALSRFHATDVSGWPFGIQKDGQVLIHGDACLPNLVFLGDELSGYVDLGGAELDDPEVDLAAAVWTLHYNLGPGYGTTFLQQYGVHQPTKELVAHLISRYEEMLKAWRALS